VKKLMRKVAAVPEMVRPRKRKNVSARRPKCANV
jgi:hypothetical protein